MRNDQSNHRQDAAQHAEVLRLAAEALAEHQRFTDGGHGSLLLIADALARSVRLLLPLVPASNQAEDQAAEAAATVRNGGAS
jgi:hypothetical protein